MAGKFEKGDIVRLKSGSPAMTVTGTGRTHDNSVTWFDDNNEPKFGEYDDEVLDSDDDE